MKKYGRILYLVTLVALMLINSFSVLGAEGEDLGTWETKASMTIRRSHMGVAQVDGKMYVMGGRNSSGYISDVEEYDSVTNSWSKKKQICQLQELLLRVLQLMEKKFML